MIRANLLGVVMYTPDFPVVLEVTKYQIFLCDVIISITLPEHCTVKQFFFFNFSTAVFYTKKYNNVT